MANVVSIEMGTGDPLVRVWIEYNNVNNRIVGVFWEIPTPGMVCRVIIWDDLVDPINPAIDRTEGQGVGSESIPGNYRMVEVTEGNETFLDLPSNIRHRFIIGSV